MKTVSVSKKILEIVEKKKEKTTPTWLEKRIQKIFGCSRKEIRNAIKELIDQGELNYTYHFGNSYLEKSFNRPVRITPRIVLKPSNASFASKPDDIVVSLDHGASFGSGEHPTTRLCLQGIEKLAVETSILRNREQSKMLDIGTGSGVLAIAGLKFGIDRAIGMDIDPCARREALKNAGLNDLERRFELYTGELNDFKPEKEDDGFDLITANLRFPTLLEMSYQIGRFCRNEGAAVFSGVRPREYVELAEFLKSLGFIRIWRAEEKSWAAGAFVKNQAVV